MFQRFTQHPTAVGESYLQHFAKASGFGLHMIAAGLACVIHAVFPFLFQHTGSDVIRNLNQAMEQRRSRNAEIEEVVPDESLSTAESRAPSIG
jgi:hypothetical protein